MILNEVLSYITKNKCGVEIGGPSPETGRVIYNGVARLDNVIFSRNTVWSNHGDVYFIDGNIIGKVIVNDATDITQVADEYYDFCFASHSLEHIANPLKAVKEWLRITKKGGFIIIVVPEKSACFDHKREYSEFSTLLTQYEKNVGEDDLSTLPEILKNHDLSMDLAAGDFAAFTRRSLDNVNNRCLHHYVYDNFLLDEIRKFFGCEYIHYHTEGLNRWCIMRKP